MRCKLGRLYLLVHTGGMVRLGMLIIRRGKMVFDEREDSVEIDEAKVVLACHVLDPAPQTTFAP